MNVSSQEWNSSGYSCRVIPHSARGPKEYLADPWICEDRNNASRLDMAGIRAEEHPETQRTRWYGSLKTATRVWFIISLWIKTLIKMLSLWMASTLHCSITTGNLDVMNYSVELGASLDGRPKDWIGSDRNVTPHCSSLGSIWDSKLSYWTWRCCRNCLQF